MSSSVFADLNHVLRSRDPSVDRRRSKRDLVDMVSHVTIDGRTHGVRIINISAHGLMCRSDASMIVGQRVSIWLPLLKDQAADIRWMQEGRTGMEFPEPIKPHIYDAMLTLIPPRQTAW